MAKLSMSDVGRVLAVEFMFFPNVVVNAELIKAWYLQFFSCEKEEFLSGLHLSVAAANRGFPPTPGEVWAMIRKLRATPESLETADAAWADLWSEKDVSARASAAANLMPDWRNRKMWLLDSLPFKKRDFDRIYSSLKEQDEILETQQIARSELSYGRDALPVVASRLLKELGWNS